MARKDKLIERYNKLRAAGFSSQDATKLKYRSDKNIDKEIKALMKEQKKAERNALLVEKYHALRELGYSSKEAGKLKYAGKERFKTLITDFIYTPAASTIKKYLSKYTYLVKYRTKDRDGNILEKYLHVVSQSKLNRAEVWDEIQLVFNDEKNKSIYEGCSVIMSSIEVVAAYEHKG